MLKNRLFIHQRIPYSFNWNKVHHKKKLIQIDADHEILNKLKIHFEKIIMGKIPNKLFNSPEIPRISQFKIKGLKSTFIRSFSRKLIRGGQIQFFNSNSKLPYYVQGVFINYKDNNIYGNPGHEPILKNILIKDKNSVAIEVPIWNDDNNKIITGHIDLIQVENNIIKVLDYKPEGNFLVSLPQVAMYGFLMKSILKIKNLKCVSFNKEKAWEYHPEILLTEIKDYLISNSINHRPWEEFIK